MTEDETNPLDAIVSKLDSLLERVEKLEAEPEVKEDSEEEKVDPRITKAESIFRGLLKDNLPKEKLDSLGLDELMLAHELKSTLKIERVKPDPPSGAVKQDQADEPFKYARKAEGVI